MSEFKKMKIPKDMTTHFFTGDVKDKWISMSYVEPEEAQKHYLIRTYFVSVFIARKLVGTYYIRHNVTSPQFDCGIKMRDESHTSLLDEHMEYVKDLVTSIAIADFDIDSTPIEPCPCY